MMIALMIEIAIVALESVRRIPQYIKIQIFPVSIRFAYQPIYLSSEKTKKKNYKHHWITAKVFFFNPWLGAREYFLTILTLPMPTAYSHALKWFLANIFKRVANDSRSVEKSDENFLIWSCSSAEFQSFIINSQNVCSVYHKTLSVHTPHTFWICCLSPFSVLN